MRQQRVGVNRRHVFLITCKQEKPFAVQPRRQVFPAQLNDVVAFPLALGGVQPGGQLRQRKAQLVQQLALRGFCGPQVGAARGGGVDDGVDRLRRQRHLLFHLGELFIKRGYAPGSLFFLSGDAAQLGQQFLPALVVVVDDKRRGDGGELIVQRQRGIAAGGADQNQIRHLRGDRFGARLANVQPRHLALFRNIPPLAQETLPVRHAVVRRGRAAGDDRCVYRQQGAG